jgi:hypothetical protein
MQSVQDPTTGEMIPTPQPSTAIRVRYSAGSGTLTARTDSYGPVRSVRVAYDPGLPMATNAAIAAQAWLDRHMEYEAELLPNQFVYDRDRFFSFRITGPKKS